MLIGPGAGAVALTRICEDGRTLPVLAAHRIAYRLRTRCTYAPRNTPVTRAIRIAADLSFPGRSLVHGPGTVTLATSARIVHSPTTTTALQVTHSVGDLRAAPVTVALGAGDAIEVLW